MVRFLSAFTIILVLTSCTDRSYSPTVPEALEVGTSYSVFAATTRKQNETGNFGYGRADTLRLLQLDVSIPPSHKPGRLEFGYADPVPERQFTMAGRSEFATLDDFSRKITRTLAALPPEQREITVFVHGFNSTQAETAFRAAQLAADTGIPGVVVIYSWPSRGTPLGYVYDNDSMLFARDGLEQLLRQLQKTTSRRIILVAHSLGSTLTMETLRQIEIRDAGWAARKLGGVVLISPDLDIEVFRKQIERMGQIPQPFVIFVSKNDKLLSLSARLRGESERQRLGNIQNVDLIADLPIEIVDTTAFSKTAGSGHFIPATSPALLTMLSQARRTSDSFNIEKPTLGNILSSRTIRGGRANAITLAPPTPVAE